MISLAGQECGNYKLQQLLGPGHSDRVYLGEHKYRRSYAAVKILGTPATNYEKTEWHNEISILSRVDHPHIVRMHEYGTDRHIRFFAMDLAKQGTLLDLFTQNIPISKVAMYVRQIASALQYLHNMHIVHRDIKLTNILIDFDGHALLADFELATDYRSCHSTTATPAYAAPEQTMGQPCPASDQYALAVIVYQWLCGELPFRGSSDDMTMQHRTVSPPPLRDMIPPLPLALEQVILTALAKDPASRFSTIQLFASALQQTSLSSSYRTPAQSLEDSLAFFLTETGPQPGR
jgi:serine/threonine protein kinase